MLSGSKSALQVDQSTTSSAGLSGHDSSAPMIDHTAAITHFHEVAFCANASSVVDGYSRFIESSLKAGNVVIVVVTETHRTSLLPKLEAPGVDVHAAIKQGRYIPLDAADTRSSLTVNDMPVPIPCTKVIGDLIIAAKGVKGTNAEL